jgi:MFS family permease
MGSSEGSSAGSFDARFWLLICATFLGFLGMGTVLPELGPHIRHDLGGSDQTVGWVIGTFSFVALAGRFFSGPLADRRGRKLTFLTGILSCALAGAAYILPIGLASAYGGRILQGFGEACLYTGAAAWAVEVAGVHRSGQALGYVSSGIWGGVACGPLIGNWMGSFQHAALFQLIAALGAFGLALLVREDFRPHAAADRKKLPLLPLLIPGLAVGFVNVQSPVMAGFLILHLANHGGSGPAAFSAYALLILLSRFFLGGLPDRIHPAITFFAGVAIMAVGLGVIAGAPSPVYAISAAGLLGFGFSFPWSAIVSTVLRRTPAQNHGSVVGILSAFYDLFVGLSSLLAGRLADQHGYPSAFRMAGFALIGSALLGVFVFSGARGTEPVAVEEYSEPTPEIA